MDIQHWCGSLSPQKVGVCLFENFAVLFELGDTYTKHNDDKKHNGYLDFLDSYGHFESKYARVASCYGSKHRLQCTHASRWDFSEHFVM